jgi:hypothetical protein
VDIESGALVSSGPTTITFITRRDCTLCDEAHDRLLPAAARLGIGVDVVDVDTDPELLAAYGTAVPVVLSAQGKVLAAGPLSAWQARLAVWRARFGRGG